MPKVCNARDVSIAEVVDEAQRITRSQQYHINDQIRAASLLVLLDIRTLIDKLGGEPNEDLAIELRKERDDALHRASIMQSIIDTAVNTLLDIKS